MNILEGGTLRPVRVAELDASELLSLGRDFITDIFDLRVTGMLVRGAFSAANVARVVERLESGAYMNREHAPKYWKGRGLGPSLYTSAPDLHEYFDEVARFRSDCAALYEGGPEFHTRLAELFTHSYASRPLAEPRGPMGEAYGMSSIRGVVPGSHVQMHCDLVQFDFPALSHLATQCDVSSVLSYFVTLATAELGGDFHIYSLTNDDGLVRAFGSMDRMSEEPALAAASYGELVLRTKPGDLLVFNSGCHFHHVGRVGGSRTRWTQGGFLARSHDGTSLVCWH